MSTPIRPVWTWNLLVACFLGAGLVWFTGSAVGKEIATAGAAVAPTTMTGVAASAGVPAWHLFLILAAGVLVMFMRTGFALVETGLTRAKNASHTMAMNLLMYPLSVVGFFVCGFALMFGGLNGKFSMGINTTVLDRMLGIAVGGQPAGVLGWKGFFLSGGALDAGVLALFFFHLMLMNITTTIPTGAMLERWKFSAFFIFGLAVSALIYPVYGCWVWGGGWLAQAGTLFGLGHGMVDLAGSSVVHLQGGILALVGTRFIGPRLGKYNRDGTLNALPAHNVPYVVLGTLILAFGWFGCNPFFGLAGADLRASLILVNTMLASALSTLAACLWIWHVRGNKPDSTMMCNGLLAGLVAISAASAFVGPLSACFIGAAAGVLAVESVLFFDRKGIDDPVGAISVHGVNGLWGVLALGLFADGTYGTGFNGVAGGVRGLFYGDARQLVAQLLGAGTCIIYVGLSSLVLFWIIEKTVGNRVAGDVELEGLDIPEMGVPGYSGVALDKFGETPISR